MTTPKDAAENLARAVRELIAVFDEQGRLADEARANAADSRSRLDEMMEGMRRGVRPDRRAFSPPRSEEVTARNRESADLSMRWEQAFCDAYEALLGLAAAPEFARAIYETAALIREIRLLQISGRFDGVAPIPPPSFAEAPPIEEADAEARTRIKLDVADRFFAWSDQYSRGVDEGYRATTERTRELLSGLEAKALSIQQEASRHGPSSAEL